MGLGHTLVPQTHSDLQQYKSTTLNNIIYGFGVKVKLDDLLDWILKSLTFDTEQLKAINFIFLGFEPCRSDFGLFGLFDLMTEGHEAFENL